MGHLKMDLPDTRRRLDDMAQGVLGTPADRPEGPLKVSGTAAYAGETQAPGMAYGVFVRATIARGRVTGIDAEAVRAMPGVIGVLDDARLARNPCQGGAGEAPVQNPKAVWYFGQPIALVVAESFEAARHAAAHAAVTYDDAAAETDPARVEPEVPEKKQSAQGDLDAALREAAFTVDATYTTASMSSAPMEPHATVAAWDGGRLTIRGSYQMLKYNRKELADAVGIEPENVRIVAPYVGGGFGSKLGIAPEAVAAALAAQAFRRPVSVTLSRRQVFEATVRRSETEQRVRLAADAEGRLIGLGHEALVSNLPDESFSEPVAQATHFTYAGAAREIVHRVARVNRTCAGSVRAPGEAVGVTVFENAMDELAEAAGIDPVELRLRNIPESHPESGIPFASHKLAEALTTGAEAFGWSERQPPRGRREGDWWIGMGVASAVRVHMLNEAVARVTLGPDATALVETDMTDIGTGTYAILRQIGAEALGLPLDAVTVRLGDTELPAGPGSGGSWGAASSGSSAYLACEGLRAQIAARMGCAETDLTLKDGDAIAGNVRRALTDVLAGDTLTEEGHLEPGKVSETARIATFGAHFAEVAVSDVTGETRVRRMLGVFAAGRILNAKTARSQCLGGMTFGIGMALHEGLDHDPRDGHIVNRDLAEYHIPVNADVPALEVILLEERDDHASPIQAKGIGELGICGAAAAITNAVYNACGARVRDYPATLDRVLAKLP